MVGDLISRVRWHLLLKWSRSPHRSTNSAPPHSNSPTTLKPDNELLTPTPEASFYASFSTPSYRILQLRLLGCFDQAAGHLRCQGGGRGGMGFGV